MPRSPAPFDPTFKKIVKEGHRYRPQFVRKNWTNFIPLHLQEMIPDLLLGPTFGTVQEAIDWATRATGHLPHLPQIEVVQISIYNPSHSVKAWEWTRRDGARVLIEDLA